MENAHNGEEAKFRMEITQKFKDALTRQANELLNSKAEFNHPQLARVVVEKRTSWAVTKRGNIQNRQ